MLPLPTNPDSRHKICIQSRHSFSLNSIFFFSICIKDKCLMLQGSSLDPSCVYLYCCTKTIYYLHCFWFYSNLNVLLLLHPRPEMTGPGSSYLCTAGSEPANCLEYLNTGIDKKNMKNTVVCGVITLNGIIYKTCY